MGPDLRVFRPEDPRARRPALEPVPWHRDGGVLMTILGISGFAAIVMGVLFFDQLYEFVNGVDLEGRYGRCSAISQGTCATVESATITAIEGQTLTVAQGGISYKVTGASGAPAGSFKVGQTVDTESAGGPVAEVRGGGEMLFTRYYVPENPFYWQWQGAAFGVFAGVWLGVYLWALWRAGFRTPLQVIRRE